MKAYQDGELTDLIMEEPKGDEIMLLVQVLPEDQAATLHRELHRLFDAACPMVGDMMPVVLQTACTLGQAGYVLGMKHGHQAAIDAAEAVERMSRGDPPDAG